MRELLRSWHRGSPTLPVFESEAKKGGLSPDQVLACLREADGKLEPNGAWQSLHAELAEWTPRFEKPTPQALYDCLYSGKMIEWNRLAAFQDVTLRLVAERLLLHLERRTQSAEPPAPRRLHSGSTYMQGEQGSAFIALRPPNQSRHVYCSPFNPGASQLVAEIANQHQQPIPVLRRDVGEGTWQKMSVYTAVTSTSRAKAALYMSDDIDDLAKCDKMLVYLNGLTWLEDGSSRSLAAEVSQALRDNIPLLLCHEMPGIGQEPQRHACPFDSIFAMTPQELLLAGVYATIAIPLKGAEWRTTSLALVLKGINAGGERSIRPLNRRLGRITSSLHSLSKMVMTRRRAPQDGPGGGPSEGIATPSASQYASVGDPAPSFAVAEVSIEMSRSHEISTTQHRSSSDL